MDAVYAKSSGIVSYKLDGLEQSLNPLNIDKISIDDIKQIIASYNEVENKKEIQEGVKVIENYTWYVCSILNEDQVKDLKEGSKVNLIFKGNEKQQINAKIIKIFDPVDGEHKITFEINEYVKDYYNIRVADITIITRQYEGFIVSKSSIVENDKQKGIFIIKKGIIRFVPAEILAFEDK